MGEKGVQTLMIAGGGTGGHIYPAIAIAREFLAFIPNRSVVFVGTERGLEKTIVPKAGFPLEFISAGGLKGKGPIELVLSRLMNDVDRIFQMREKQQRARHRLVEDVGALGAAEDEQAALR